MSNFFNGGSNGNKGGTNLPTRTSGSSLASLTAASKNVTKAGTQPVATSTGSSSSLGALTEAKKKADQYRQRPFLVYLILDLTASRGETRSAMQSYEKQIAKLVMESGGKHPVLCKGVYYKGNHCSEPQILGDAEAVQSFFDTRPEGGGTFIHQALTHYKNDKTDAVLSLAILIGDTADSDSESELVALAKSMQNDKSHRPVVIAYEQTSDGYSPDFCRKETGIACKVASASGGFGFGLSEHPAELIAMLEGYRKILNATPEELKETVKAGAANGNAGVFSRLSPQGREFLTNQARRLSVPLLGKPTGT